MSLIFNFFNYQSLKYPDFKCLKKRGFRINELYSQMGFYFQKVWVFWKLMIEKKSM